MYSDSRKAQRNSFAHHRAELLFSQHRAEAGDPKSAPIRPDTERAPLVSRMAQVRAGLLGFVPMQSSPA